MSLLTPMLTGIVSLPDDMSLPGSMSPKDIVSQADIMTLADTVSLAHTTEQMVLTDTTAQTHMLTKDVGLALTASKGRLPNLPTMPG